MVQQLAEKAHLAERNRFVKWSPYVAEDALRPSIQFECTFKLEKVAIYAGSVVESVGDAPRISRFLGDVICFKPRRQGAIYVHLAALFVACKVVECSVKQLFVAGLTCQGNRLLRIRPTLNEQSVVLRLVA